MEELPKKDKKQEVRDEIFRRHFGSLSMEAAQMSVDAYCDEGPDRDIALAWLRDNMDRLTEIVGDVGKEERNKMTREAMTKATNQLMAHKRMKKHLNLLNPQ